METMQRLLVVLDSNTMNFWGLTTIPNSVLLVYAMSTSILFFML